MRRGLAHDALPFGFACSAVRRAALPRLAGVLEAHRKAHDPRTVLPLVTQRGTMLNPANARNRWHARTLRSAGLETVTLHALRHSAASIAVAAGESILFVQQTQLGHANVRTTQRYAHAGPPGAPRRSGTVANYLSE